MSALAAATFGEEGPSLVILHGLFGSKRNWTRIARGLSRGYRVHTLDLPNHGDSAWTETATYPAMADAVRAYLDDAGIERATLIGHSMGGKVAMTLALTHPERLARLIVVDIAPVPTDSTHLTLIDVMRDLDLSRITRRGEAEATLEKDIPDPALRAFLMQNLVQGPDGFRWRVNLDALAANLETLQAFPEPLLTHSFDGPTLFLVGALSDYVKAEDAPLIGRLFPGAGIVSVENAGHWLHAENPAAFLAAVEDFLAA